MADSNSIFYKIGQATKTNVANAISGLLSGNNTWTGTNDFNKAVTVGTDGESADLSVKGGVSSTGAVSGNTVSATGAVSGGSVTATGAVSGATLSTTGNATIGGKATINGDLVVKGTTTTLSTSTLEVDDNFIHLSKGANDGAYSKDSGLYFERASGSDATAFIWDEDKGRFVLGSVGSGGETGNAVTFEDVGAQVGSSAGGATIGVSVAGNLGLTSEYAGGSAKTPESLLVMTGSVDQKKITVNGLVRDLISNISDTLGTGLYAWTAVDMGSGNFIDKYGVLVYVAPGDTLGDITKLHVWDDGYGMFYNGESHYIENPNDGISFVSGAATYGGATFTLSISDATAGVGADSDAVAFSGGSASVATTGETVFSPGSYDVTFTLKDELANQVTTMGLKNFEIKAQAGGSNAIGADGQVTPFHIDEGKITYIADNETATTFNQIALDASKLVFSPDLGGNSGFSSSDAGNGSYLEVSFPGDTPGSSDTLNIAAPLTGTISEGGQATAAAGPDADTAEVTPGKFLAGQVEIVDATDGVVALGDLADFNAGLSA